MSILQDEIVRAGINLTNPSMRARISSAEEVGTRKYQAAVDAQNSLRPQWAVKISELAGKAQSYVSVAFVLSFILFGMCVAVMLQFIAEYKSVEAGLSIAVPDLAPLFAAAMVLIYIVLLFIRSLTEKTAVRPIALRWSLRTTANQAAYLLGFYKPEIAQPASLLKRMDKTIMWLTVGITLLGMLGRLTALLAPTVGVSWQQGLSMLATSDIKSMASLIASPIITLALLTSTEFVVMWICQLFNEVTGGMSFKHFLATGDTLSLADYQNIERDLLYQTILAQHKLKSLPQQSLTLPEPYSQAGD